MINALIAVNETTVNVPVAMAGLSVHTQRAYTRWICLYLSIVNKEDRASIDLSNLYIAKTLSSLNAALLSAWIGQLKAKGLSRTTITQGKSAVVWLAQLIADMGYADHSLAYGLSRVKTPRAESGQRKGMWLTQDEIRKLICTSMQSDNTRDAVIIVLMAACGLRRNEITSANWGDLKRDGYNAVLHVHGKGEKLRTVKLPHLAVQVIERWKLCHPEPTETQPIFSRIWKNGTVTRHRVSDRAIWLVVRKAAKLAGLPPISPHDLRRSFARGAYEAGVSLELIRQTLGHSHIAITEHYVNCALELDRSATDLWADALGIKVSIA